ncbi:MAG: 16S rRNA (guanine(966)-N(2))-methyltransferase RsmD [Clostridiales bacterium]|nr:16S rRNA (guanine(966)-N(2))-methyltransferase RsmD [Clostridiales bacterium]
MRIITGTARGAKLATIEGDATRPTTDRVKEAIFSMIQFDIEGRRVLDLFGGSGQLALEALSRGAERATIIDESRDAVNIIIENAKHAKLYEKCRISCCSYASFLKGFNESDKFNIVFLDPPYNTSLLHDSLNALSVGNVLADGALIICESDTPQSKKKSLEKKNPELKNASILHDVFSDDEKLMSRYNIEKSSAYGRTRITVLSLADTDK